MALLTEYQGQFYVSEVQEIEWQDDAIEKLVLGEDEKSLLLALVANAKSSEQRSFDDFITSKGMVPCTKLR